MRKTLFIFYLIFLTGTLIPSPIVKSNIKNIDLLIHFSYLFFLSLLTFSLINIYISFVFLIIFSFLTEILQIFISTRNFSLKDFSSELIGIIFALLIYKFILKREKNVFIFFSSLLGIGFIKGGGTIASIFSIILFYIFKPSISAILILFILTIAYTLHFGKFLNFKKDPSFFVLDEFSGFFLILPFLNFNYLLIILSFLLYRAFDILKPFGIKKLERIKTFGILLDDYAAGIFTLIIIIIIKFLFRQASPLLHPLSSWQHISLNSFLMLLLLNQMVAHLL